MQAGSVALSPSYAYLPTLDLGAVEASGVTWGLDDIQGWGGPASTIQVTQKPRSDGGWAGRAWMTARVLSLTGWVSAPTTALLSDANDRLQAAVSVDLQKLTVSEAGRARWMMIRRQGEVLFTATSDTAANWSIQVVAPDPRRFVDPVTQSTGLPSSSGGLTFPVTFPVTFTGTTNSGTLSINNDGTAVAPVKIRITGPVVGPIVTHIGSGLQLVFSTSMTLGVGEWLDIDMEAKTVLAQGQSSRNGYIISRGWFGADPGSNQYAFQAQTFSAGASMSVTVPSGAWL